MKKIFISIAFAAILFFGGCEQRTDIDLPTASTPVVNTGTADFKSFVTLGNSITAGYQSGSLFESGQQYSFGKLIAKQVGTAYEVPFMEEKGTAGKVYIASINITTVPATVNLGSTTTSGQPKNSQLAKPYNNLGVPGAILYDLYDSSAAYRASRWAPASNPFFSIVLRNADLFGKTEYEQAKKLNPTFMTLWIGNNDVLGYATSGGTKGTDPTQKLPTDVSTFGFIYSAVLGRIATDLPNTKLAVANIPDVDAIPFFTTVGPSVSASLKAKSVTTGFFYGTSTAYGMATNGALDSLKTMLTLSGSAAASFIGDTTGKYYAYAGITVPGTVNVKAPFGLHPANPFPDKYVLDPSEKQKVSDAVVGFNTAIAGLIAGKANIAFVDVNALFKSIRSKDMTAAGSIYYGISFRTSYLSGGLFSLDGVHPTSQGHGILANEFIAAINAKFSASIPSVNVSLLPAGFSMAKQLPLNNLGLPQFPKGFFDNLQF
ncbi:MAG: hypothetical protein HYV28_01360 [Ignavibacteriales bacterium]|nr:hypothetical protein [Ignavibacteriales bacterium]